MERSERKTRTSKAQLRAMRKVRGDWGDVKPYTRIEAAKKNRYDRKQNRRLEREARYDYEG